MKHPLFTLLVLACAFTLAAFSQEIVERMTGSDSANLSTESKTQIIGEVADGKSTNEKAPKPEPIDFEVIKSQTQKVQVKESPEMPGLPAPEGMMNLKVELVNEPELEELLPLPLLEAKDPAVVARVGELSKENPDTKLLLVSASVYNNSVTQFRIQANEPGAKEITGWSNIDFKHFSGFATYQVKGADGVLRSYGLVMSIGDMDKIDPSVNIPRLPHLATSGPAFVLTDGEINDPKTKQLVEDIHNLYKVEGKRLAEAHRKRTKAYEERKAYLLANPPKPKDVTIRFWNRDGSNPR